MASFMSSPLEIVRVPIFVMMSPASRPALRAGETDFRRQDLRHPDDHDALGENINAHGVAQRDQGLRVCQRAPAAAVSTVSVRREMHIFPIFFLIFFKVPISSVPF
jgi:hypothetical protein